MWHGRAVVVLLGVAACGPPKDPNHAETSCMEVAGASDDRSTFAYVDSDGYVVTWTRAGTRKIKRPVCLERAKELFVAPGGIAVGGFGTARMLGDWWGHSTPQVTAHCVVEIATGKETPLEDPESMVWIGAELIAIPRARLPLEGTCATATTTSGPIALCIAGSVLVIRHYRGVLLDADPDTTWPLPEASERPHIAIAPDGKRVAIWDATKLRVIDTASGRVLMTFVDVANVETVELDPAGADRVMLVGKAYEVGESPDHHIRILGFDGKVRETLVEPGADRTVYWTDPAAYWSTNTCGVDRRSLPAR